MAYTTIDKSDEYFNTVLYTGNGSTQSITGVGFQPNFVWIKQRNGTYYHRLIDSVRGATKELYSNGTDAEATEVNSLTSFNTDGFTLGSLGAVNSSGDTFASWNFLAGGTAVSNTQGSITSSVSANTTSGFSIVSYTGTGSAGSIGHGLGSTPKMIIKKKRSGADAWNVWHTSIGDGSKALYLNLTNAIDTNANYASNVPTSSLFYVGTDSMINASSATYIAYCFAEKKGFSKFGSYTGNGSADGTFIYTGFKPAFVMIKASSLAGENWYLIDSTRSTYNPSILYLSPNNSGAEASPGSGQFFDFLSNGFKLRVSGSYSNSSGATYIYMAFAENPLVTSGGTPTTAR